MTNVSVISAAIKPDKPAPHEKNNIAKARNCDKINDQSKTDNKMIIDDNQRNLNIKFYKTNRCCNQSELNVMPVYQLGDSVSNQA